MSPLPTEDRAWRQLSPAEQAALMAVGYVRAWRSGEIIALQGGPPGSMFVILSGWVKISVTNERGDTAPVAARGPGAIVGELAPISGRPRTAAIEAMGTVRALVVPPGRLRDALRQRPHIAEALLGAAAARLQQSDRLRIESGGTGLPQRLAAVLVELGRQCAPESDGAPVELPFGQAELAGFARVSRSTLVRGLDRLRALGLVTTARRRITIVNLHALQDLAIGRNP